MWNIFYVRHFQVYYFMKYTFQVNFFEETTNLMKLIFRFFSFVSIYYFSLQLSFGPSSLCWSFFSSFVFKYNEIRIKLCFMKSWIYDKKFNSNYKTAQLSITKLRSLIITNLRKIITNLRRNYKSAQKNYKSAQKLQICAKITKVRITKGKNNINIT